MKLNQEMMALYKAEQVNPAAGCLPVLLQIPVFFALYKVLFVTIEMRHAPFFGWIADLSALIQHQSLICLACCPIPFHSCHLFCSQRLADFDGHFNVLQMRLNPAHLIRSKLRCFNSCPFLYLLAGNIPGWSGDLLDMEQPVINGTAMVYHETRSPRRDIDDLEIGRLLFAGSCEFIAAANGRKRCCRLLAGNLFCGRSNVGKSSLVNALTGRRMLATHRKHRAYPSIDLFQSGKSAAAG